MINKRESNTHKHFLFGAFVCTIAAIFYCYEFFLRIVPGALHQELMVAFGNISASRFGEIASLYYLAYSPMQLPVGMLMDRYGPRRLLSFAALCCTLGSIMFSYSGSLTIAGTGRFLVGFGSSFAFVGVLSLAWQWLPRQFFSLVAGLVTTLGMLGLVYGQIKVTSLAATMGLPFVLEMMVVIGCLLTVIIVCTVRDGPNHGRLSQQTLSDFFHQVLNVLFSKKVWLIGFIAACLYASLSIFGELWGKVYLENAYHLNSVDSAKLISKLFLGWAVGAPLTGYLADRLGNRVLLLSASAFMSLLCISFVLYSNNLSFYSLSWLLFLYGVFSGVEIILFLMAKENIAASLSATVFAVTNMIVSLAAVILQPMVGWLLDFSANRGSVITSTHLYTVSDYRFALSIIPVLLIITLIALCFLKDKTELIDK